MDLGQGLSTYENAFIKIHTATSAVFDILYKKAVKEEKKENAKNGRLLLTLNVSGDGSWKIRGFSSLFVISMLIGYYTGKIIDLVVKGTNYALEKQIKY